MKFLTEALAAVGLIRPVRQRGYCPACKGWNEGTGDPTRGARREVDPAALTVLVVLGLAAVAWILTVEQSQSTAAMDMDMGLGSLQSFATTWLVMMAAMMLPSALPLVYEFARNSEGRRGWQVATAALGVAYLSVWLVFGLLCYAVYCAVNMPWPDQPLIGGLALVLAGLYAITPIKRASEARCRELCALHHGPLPFNLLHSALVVGTRYSLSCMGCTAGLMVAAVIIGMTSLGWMVVISVLILVYKLAPPLGGKYRLLASLAVSALGIAYMLLA
jgi:predicted metal-binding membrane protein